MRDVSGLSVVVPSRGEAAFLDEALASVCADGSARAEVIVVEDGTRRLDPARLRGARLIQVGHLGRSLARNAGVEAARTPLVAFLDADDTSLPGRLARQADALAAAPGSALCFGRVEAIDKRSRPIPGDTALERARFDRLLQRGLTYESLLADCPIYTSGTMVRRDAFLAAGGYDARLDAYEDLDLYLRLARKGALVPCDGTPVARHRRHPGNTPSDYLYAGALRLAEKHLPEAEGAARRLLLERRLDSLWGLGDFGGARAHALRAIASEPRLAGHPRFGKRLLACGLPLPLLRALRSRR